MSERYICELDIDNIFSVDDYFEQFYNEKDQFYGL